MDWQTTFSLEAGKTYRIRYVRVGEDTVREGSYIFHGEIHPGNRAIVVMDPDDRTSVPGPVSILQIDEQVAPADIRKSR